jgi:hypothetical protein
VRIALEAETAAAEPAGRKRRGCARDDQQRHRLLPIPFHDFTITPFSALATNVFNVFAREAVSYGVQAARTPSLG